MQESEVLFQDYKHKIISDTSKHYFTRANVARIFSIHPVSYFRDVNNSIIIY